MSDVELRNRKVTRSKNKSKKQKNAEQISNDEIDPTLNQRDEVSLILQISPFFLKKKKATSYRKFLTKVCSLSEATLP